ncbi:MAG TPA: serine/threonine-protein kinase [Bryobacteraceae bacterium]|nr:serine/threonine-protein kinase [Bryobacteraceae bacterium]
MADADRDQRIANALAEFHDRQARQEAVDLEEYCRQYPDLPELRDALETWTVLDEQIGSTAGADGEPPERLSNLKILSQIGSGGMGRVYLALDEALGRKVAIKTLHPRYLRNEVLRGRFMREARSLAQLSHPNVVRIYGLGKPDEPPHFVMEHLEGVPLTQAAHPLDLRQKAELLHKVMLAVDFLHQHHLIHRDLKPANILVGADLEPKLLDLGLALPLEDRAKLTQSGEIMGTPDYFAPEQATGAAVDPRTDIFALGTILYELLTGSVPFRGARFSDRVRSICEQDPVLPRRVDSAIPGELQNICLKALEKSPADRYASAREMADDLERYLAGEPVLATPTAYSRLTAAKVEQHLRELEAWRNDRILSDYEFDSFRKSYDRLTEREDAWIMEVRRLSLPQVTLYLGSWLLVVAAALVTLFRNGGVSGAPAVLLTGGAAAATVWVGMRVWRTGEFRIALAWLLAFCLLLPLTFLIAMNQYGWFAALTRNDEKLEFFTKLDALKRITNAQFWWAILLALPAYYALRRFTRASVFSLVLAMMSALLCLNTLLRMGMLQWLEEDPGRFYFHLIPFALLFLAAGYALERLGAAADSRYFYPIAVAFMFVALSGAAAQHKPWADWLKSVAPWTRGQVEYLFIMNAGAYLGLQALCELFPTAQLRMVGRAFRFVIPGHVLTSLWLLGMAATDLWQGPKTNPAYRLEARVFEFVLPAAACVFVFASVPKQMKNYFAWGLGFLAIGLVRLQQDFFKDWAPWPISLLIVGLLLMAAAARYSRIFMTFRRWMPRSR